VDNKYFGNIKESKYKNFTVKPVFNDHPGDPKIVAVVERLLLFRGHLYYTNLKRDPKKVAVIDR
jgi:hypothetical protein